MPNSACALEGGVALGDRPFPPSLSPTVSTLLLASRLPFPPGPYPGLPLSPPEFPSSSSLCLSLFSPASALHPLFATGGATLTKPSKVVCPLARCCCCPVLVLSSPGGPWHFLVPFAWLFGSDKVFTFFMTCKLPWSSCRFAVPPPASETRRFLRLRGVVGGGHEGVRLRCAVSPLGSETATVLPRSSLWQNLGAPVPSTN